jgi:hypothetical protein
MPDLSVTFLGFGGGGVRELSDTTVRTVAVGAEIGGRVLREWIESRIEDRDPVGWGTLITAPAEFTLLSLDAFRFGGFPSPSSIDDEERYLVQVVDTNADRLAATDAERWLPSILAIAAALASA